MANRQPSSLEIGQALKVLEDAGMTFRSHGSQHGMKLTADAVARELNRVGDEVEFTWINWNNWHKATPKKS